MHSAVIHAVGWLINLGSLGHLLIYLVDRTSVSDSVMQGIGLSHFTVLGTLLPPYTVLRINAIAKQHCNPLVTGSGLYSYLLTARCTVCQHAEVGQVIISLFVVVGSIVISLKTAIAKSAVTTRIAL